MIYPFIRLMATRPELLADHALAYADLVAEEVDEVSTDWKRRMMLSAVAVCFLGVAVVLAGVAVMLWALAPQLSNQAWWILVATPMLPAALAVWCWLAARARQDASPFGRVWQHVQTDIAALREARAT